MVSLGQNELIGIIALVSQDIHHYIIVFCNIVESRQNMRKRLNTCNFDAQRIISIWFIAISIIWCDNPLHIIIHGDNWHLSDSNWICFQLKIHEMVIEIKMKLIPIISFSVDAIGVSYITVSIFKFTFMLINLMAIISDINVIYVLSTMFIESMMG